MSSLPGKSAVGSSTLWSSLNSRRALVPVLVLTLAAGMLWVALRNIDFNGIMEAITRLSPGQVALLLGIDIAIHCLVGLRWWLIVRVHDRHVPFLPLTLIRLASFGISYITVGPQVGGEPLQVLFLRRTRRSPMVGALSSVLLDKLLELLTNSALLLIALVVLAQTGRSLLAAIPIPVAVLLALGLPALPAVYLVLLVGGHHPFASIASAGAARFRGSTLLRHVRAAEKLTGRLCRRNLPTLGLAIFVSLLAGSMSVTEYFLITSFLSPGIAFWQSVSAWGAGWLSFLMPSPAGLGALEVSQILVLGAFGVSPATAIAVVLVMRARDLLFAGAGLVVGGSLAALFKSDRGLGAVVAGEET